jgi:hypothetical protein
MGKSPFAVEQTETYEYPHPLDPEVKDDQEKIDQEVIDGAKEPGEELPWVKFRVPRSKKDVDAIGDYTQSVAVTGTNGSGAAFEARIARGNRQVFALLCEGWSFSKDPSAEDFDRLDLWSASWIMACVNDAIGKGSLAAGKKTEPSSTKPVRGRAASAAAKDSTS